MANDPAINGISKRKKKHMLLEDGFRFSFSNCIFALFENTENIYDIQDEGIASVQFTENNPFKDNIEEGEPLDIQEHIDFTIPAGNTVRYVRVTDGQDEIGVIGQLDEEEFINEGTYRLTNLEISIEDDVA